MKKKHASLLKKVIDMAVKSLYDKIYNKVKRI